MREPDCGVPKITTGKSRPQILDCAAQCAGDACVQNCVTQGTPVAQSAFAAIVNCINATHCANDDTCKTKCQTQIAACK